MKTTAKHHRRAGSSALRVAGWLGVVAMLAIAVLGPSAAGAAAASVTPTAHEGNVKAEDCPQGTIGLTITPPADSDSGSGVTVDVTYDNDTKSFDFTVSGGVVMVAFVKGGDDYNEYDYSPAGTTGDTDLVAPNNASGGPAGLSHMVFCVVENQETEPPTETTPPTEPPTETTPPTEPPTETAPPTGEVLPTPGTPEPTGEVQAATGTPRTTLPPTDTVGGDQGQGGGTWRMLLIVMAGLLSGILALTPKRARR